MNQDSPWDVPTTPPPESGKESQPSAVWRAPVNMGTEIWENNLRMNKGSGSSVPAQTTSAPPWGHTPATNIGGHWGDDDSSNMWSGVPPTNTPNPANWSDSNSANSNMWGNPMPSEKHWSGSGSGQSSWGGKNSISFRNFFLFCLPIFLGDFIFFFKGTPSSASPFFLGDFFFFF